MAGKKRLLFLVLFTFFVFCTAVSKVGFADISDVLGKWKRVNGAELEIKSDSVKGITATLHVPSLAPQTRHVRSDFRHVARTELSTFDGRPRVYIQLDPGDFFDLVLEEGELRGVFYNALQRRLGFRVRFYRPEVEKETTVIDGILFPRDVIARSFKGGSQDSERLYIGFWKGKIGATEVLILVEDIKDDGKVDATLGYKELAVGGFFISDYIKLKGTIENRKVMLRHLFPEHTLILERQGEEIRAEYRRAGYSRDGLSFPASSLKGVLTGYKP